MDLTQIRKTVITAIFSDDLLMNEFVLKGGNALNLVYNFGSRSSIDVDLSMEGDFENIEVLKNRLFSVLRRDFAGAGYLLFDERILEKPSSKGGEDWEEWGGYQAEFKIIPKEQFRALKGDLEAIRRSAAVVSPLQARVFKIQISKFEYCAPRAKRKLENCSIYVYTPAMIAVEKLRALCQQMPEYHLVRHKRPRARDFYDIYSIVSEGAVNLGTEANLELTRNIFAAKRVPLSLIPRIPTYREFHRQDWGVVQDSVSGELQAFDFYFDFVVHQLPHLESLWVK
jgi:predicted nucleotidyltransferase component of viral defense system